MGSPIFFCSLRSLSSSRCLHLMSSCRARFTFASLSFAFFRLWLAKYEKKMKKKKMYSRYLLVCVSLRGLNLKSLYSIDICIDAHKWYRNSLSKFFPERYLPNKATSMWTRHEQLLYFISMRFSTYLFFISVLLLVVVRCVRPFVWIWP